MNLRRSSTSGASQSSRSINRHLPASRAASSRPSQRRKAVVSRFSQSQTGRDEFEQLRKVPTALLPPNLVSTISERLATKFTTGGEYCISSKGCLTSLHLSPSNPRPSVNLSNTRLEKKYLNPRYHFLSKFKLSFGDLAKLIRHRHDPSKVPIAYKASASIKLAHLAYLISNRGRVTPGRVGTNEDVSHLCGTPECFSPDHVVLESREQNLSRNPCFKASKKGEVKKGQYKCRHTIPCLLDIPAPISIESSPEPPRPQVPKVKARRPSSVFLYVLVPPMPTNIRRMVPKMGDD